MHRERVQLVGFAEESQSIVLAATEFSWAARFLLGRRASSALRSCGLRYSEANDTLFGRAGGLGVCRIK
jgi:hypothetical protein